jgi:catechol 2,3-dioxygenase-like lactoylglutathione lyase family enzyme
MNTLNRRQFCETVALAVAAYAAGKRRTDAAPARGSAPARGFRIIGINHISYACPDYRKARDFYASALGMENLPSADNGRETRLMFGPAPGKGGSFLIPRNGRTATSAEAIVDHICYAISNWDEMRVRSALRARGLEEPAGAGGLHVYDPFDYDVQLTGGPAASAPASASASAGSTLKIASVNHISYTSPDVKRAADWYSKIFNLDQIDASASQVTLPFGKQDEDLPHLIIRARETVAPATRRKSKALVNHVAYTIADFEKERVRAELKRLGYPQPLQDGEHSFHIVDPNGFDVQISGIQMTALGG